MVNILGFFLEIIEKLKFYYIVHERDYLFAFYLPPNSFQVGNTSLLLSLLSFSFLWTSLMSKNRIDLVPEKNNI